MNLKPRTSALPVFVIAFGILAVSTASLFIRYAQNDAHSLVIAAYRLSLASIILTPFAFHRCRIEAKQLTPREIRFALLSGFFLALHFATWITSLAYTTVASSAVLVATIPLWVVLIAPITIKEPTNRLAIAGLLLALLGSVIVGFSDGCTWQGTELSCPSITELSGRRAFLGDLLAVVGAIMGALYLLIGKRLRGKISLLSYIYVVYGMAAIVLVIFVLVARLPITGYSSKTYLWFLLLALVPQLLGHSSFNWALKYLSAGYVSISLLGEPIASSFLASIFLQETPSISKIIGALFILGGIVIASKQETT
jgi:drug/metabolite transporter (DMT)-like permease